MRGRERRWSTSLPLRCKQSYFLIRKDLSAEGVIMFAVVGFALGLMVPSSLMALTPAQFSMRTCVSETLADPSKADIQPGDFCTCVISELEQDMAGNPDKYVYKRTGSAWSQKRQQETEARGQQALEGHKAYCEAITGSNAPRASVPEISN